MSIVNSTQFKGKQGFRNWRISVKLLVVMLVLILIPLVIVTYLGTRTGSELLKNEAIVNLEMLSHSTAQQIQQLLEDTHYFLRFTASNPDVISYLTSDETSGGNGKDVNNLISYLIQANPSINIVSVFDGKGTVVAHSNPVYVGLDYSFRDYVQAGLNGQEYTSGILVGTTDGQPGIISAAPVSGDQGIIGAVSMRIRGQLVSEILQKTLNLDSKQILEEDLSAIDIYLVNQYGIVMSHSDSQSEWLYKSLGVLPEEEFQTVMDTRMLGLVCPDGSDSCSSGEKVTRQPEPMVALVPLRDELLAAMDTAQSGSMTYCRPDDLGLQPRSLSDCDGEKHVVGFSPVVDKATGGTAGLFMVVVDVPETIFLEGIGRFIVEGAIVSFIVAAVGAAIALLVARMLARPICRLAQAARDVEEEKPFEPQDIAEVIDLGDEVGHLARVFSNMVVALRARMAELRTIYEIGQEISAGVEFDETLKYILSAIHNVIPYDMAELGFYDGDNKQIIVRTDADYVSSRVEKIVYYEPETARIYDVDKGVLARLLETGSALLISDYQEDQDLEVDAVRKWGGGKARSYLGVLLKAKGKVIGSIELVSTQPNTFNEDNSRLLTSIAVQAAIEVQNAKDIQERERLLEQQILNMEIVIDDDKQNQQVEAITSREFFKDLQAQKRKKKPK